MSDLFYRAFEEKYRGSRDIIKSRLRVYFPFVQVLLKAYPAGKALDVGCGRGEWLELLGELGFDAVGVDLDNSMLEACRDRNLKVETADAVTFMQGLPESSLCVVSGFHIAEHLPFDLLLQLVQQAFRVLLPGGLLILETPNPENICVGSNSFYLDPTHQRPIPPELLSFLPEYCGFARFKVMRLQESAHLQGDGQVDLLDVLNGVSPDYAVLAQKQGMQQLMEALNPAFDQHQGLSLYDLALRHEKAIEKRFATIEVKAQQAQERAMHAEAKAQHAQMQTMHAEAKAQHLNDQWIEARNESVQVRAQMQQTLDLLHTALTQMQHAIDRADKAEAATEQLQQELQSTAQDLQAARQELHDVHQSNQHHFTQLEQTRKELHDVHQANHKHWLQVQERDQQLAAMQASKSWRITAPLRWCFGQARPLKAEGLASRFKALVKKVLRKFNYYLLTHPALRQKLLKLSHRLGIYTTLKAWSDQLRNEPVLPTSFPVSPIHAEHTVASVELTQLTPRARQIYAELKRTIASQKGGH